MWASVYENMQPILVTTISAFLTAILAWAANTFSKKVGIQVEQKQQDDLHRALMTGVRFALEKLGDRATKEQVIEQAVQHAQTSVPDAIKGLQPSAGVLTKIAASKLAEAKAAPIADVLATVAGVGVPRR